MPKGKRKGKHEGKKAEVVNNSASDDESGNDNASEWSTQSETRSVQEDADETSEEALKDVDRFEEALSTAVDGLGQKSAAGRACCLAGAAGALRARWAPGSVAAHRLSLSDHAERCLKRGKTEEQAAAADLAALIAIQFGASDFCEELYKMLKPVLLTLALDKSVNANTRAKCVAALGLITFLAEDEMGSIYEVMRHFETIFSGSYLKGDGTVKTTVSAEQEALHSAALSAWALLLSLASPGDVCMMLGGSTTSFTPSLRQLGGMLSSPGLEVRLGAGECLALAFQLGREHSEAFGQDALPELIDDMKQLATDSHKYRAKKDRKTQRATFRDILRYLEDDDIEDIVVRIKGETLRVEGWCARRRYSALGAILGTGLPLHLACSPALRAALLMPPPLLNPSTHTPAARTNNKLLRHLQNAANFKARTISRGKNRDKRSAVVVSF